MLGPGVMGLLSTEKDSEFFMEVFPDAGMQFAKAVRTVVGLLCDAFLN